MSRTLGGPLAAHLATRTHTLCMMLRLDLKDGTSIGITDHDRDLDFDLGDGSISYSASTGVLPSDVSLSTGFEADNFEVTGPIGATVTLAAVLGGRFNRARVRMFMVNWASLGSGAIKIMAGDVATNARVEGGRFVFPVQSDVGRLNQTVGRVITPYCNADLGDARCGFALVPVEGTVTAMTDAMRFTVSFSGSYANDYFNKGTVTFTSGNLTGTQPVEIEDWTSGGAITLLVPLVEAPAINDVLDIKQGCDKRRATCRDTFSNIDNFRGFSEVPGSDQVLKYVIPSGS